MAAVRTLDATQRGWLLLLLACALLVRAIVPAGWMPVAGADGVHIVPCVGTQPVAPPQVAHHAMATMEHGSAPGHHESRADQPCAFAGLAAALHVPVPAVPLVLACRHVETIPAPMPAAIGLGLAAPPPPQTGPPVA